MSKRPKEQWENDFTQSQGFPPFGQHKTAQFSVKPDSGDEIVALRNTGCCFVLVIDFHSQQGRREIVH